MNIKEIREMIQLMNENSLTEIELEQDGLKIRLKKNSAGFVEPSVIQNASPLSPAAFAKEGLESKEPLKPALVQTPKINIKSPMVGTFYAAPAPDAPPFVQVGSEVQVGQVICVIEAMKLMNEIKAEVRGKIAEILVNNGDPVEFGQPLFSLE